MAAESRRDLVDLYREGESFYLCSEASTALPRVCVPNVKSNDDYVIAPASYRVIGYFKVGRHPRHIVPSWDLKTLWVANNATRPAPGSLTPLDPATSKPGKPVAVDDPYNLYFTPDGQSGIVVAEAKRRVNFRDPHIMRLRGSLATPACRGINHADFALNGDYAIFMCEFSAGLVNVDPNYSFGHTAIVR